MLVYGSFSDRVSKLVDLKAKDFPSTSGIKNIMDFLATGSAGSKATDGDACGHGDRLSEADELRLRMRTVARAKVAKLFDILVPSAGTTPEAQAQAFSAVVAAQTKIGANETGVVWINSKLWTEAMSSPHRVFAPILSCNLSLRTLHLHRPSFHGLCK